MKHDIWINFFNRKPIEIASADKIELLAIGRGVLSVINNGINRCYNLENIDCYYVKDSEEEGEEG